MRKVVQGTLAAIALQLLALPTVAQNIAQPVYYFISSDPDPFQRAISPIYGARLKAFDKARILSAYDAFLRRTIGAGWYKYSHHASLYGPFGSIDEAQSEHRKQIAAPGWGKTTLPRELAGFRHFDVSVVLTTVMPATGSATGGSAAQASESAPKGRLDWRLALREVPMTVYGEQEWSWERSLNNSDMTTSIQELQPAAILIWVDPQTSLDPDSPEMKTIQKTSASASLQKLTIVMVLPGRSMDALAPSLRKLQNNAIARGGRLEFIADETARMRVTLQRSLRQILQLTILPIKINELMANNKKAVQGPAGGFPDWIEIVNLGDEPVDIGGMYMTEKGGAIGQRRISMLDASKTTVPPRKQIVLWLNGRQIPGADHLGIKLSSKGDRVALFDMDGLTLIDEVEFGNQEADKSLARVPDGSDNWVSNRSPTPGKTNGRER